MPHQKVSLALTVSALPLEGPDVMAVLEGIASDMAMDSVEAMSAALDFEKALRTPWLGKPSGSATWSTKPSE